MAIQTIAIVAILALVSSYSLVVLPPAYAQSASNLPDPGFTPDQPVFYGFKRFIENVDIALTFNPIDKAAKQAGYAEVRIAEAHAMIQAGRTEYVPQLMSEYQSQIDRSLAETRQVSDIGSRAAATAIVVNATSKHIELLQQVLEQVPEQAKPTIQTAISNSQIDIQTIESEVKTASTELKAEYEQALQAAKSGQSLKTFSAAPAMATGNGGAASAGNRP